MKCSVIIASSFWALGGIRSGGAEISPQLLFPQLLQTGFEEAEVGCLPAGWQVLEGQWQVGEDEGQRVLRQSNPLLYDRALASFEWADYAVEAEFRCAPGTDPWGVGLVGYWQDPDHHYRCCIVNNALHLVKVEGERVTSLTQIRQEFGRERWYRARFTLRTKPPLVALRGEVWPVGEERPQAVLETTDAQPGCLQRGRVGLWTGHAEGAFRNLKVTSLDPPGELYEETFQTGAKGYSPAHWATWGGHWISDLVEGQVAFRQIREGTDLSFDDNALAVLEWRNYQFHVRLKAEPQDQAWGLGAVGYFQDAQNHYRLRFLREQLRLFKKQGGEDVELATVPFAMAPNQWYHLRFRMEETRAGVWLRGKMWTGEVEPAGWTINAEDRSNPLSGGAIGFLTFLTAASFDDLEIAYNQPYDTWRVLADRASAVK